MRTYVDADTVILLVTYTFFDWRDFNLSQDTYLRLRHSCGISFSQFPPNVVYKAWEETLSITREELLNPTSDIDSSDNPLMLITRYDGGNP